MISRRTVSVCAFALLLTGCSAAPPAAEPVGVAARASSLPAAAAGLSGRLGRYVALGDSWTAGFGVPPQQGTPAGCGRSGANYPAVVARHLGLAPSQLTDVSCSGAATGHLTTSQATSDGVNPAQLSAITSDTGLVTVGIGGNDVGFGPAMERCVRASLAQLPGPADAPCRDEFTRSGTAGPAQISAAGARLADALRVIRTVAPGSRTLVVGYPALLPTDGAGCARALPLSPTDIRYLDELQRALNDELRQRASAGGAMYADTYEPSRGHDSCAAPSTRWIEPLVLTNPAASLHPNARGEAGIADAVLRTMRSEAVKEHTPEG